MRDGGLRCFLICGAVGLSLGASGCCLAVSSGSRLDAGTCASKASTLSPAASYAAPALFRSAGGDLDGDGQLDLVVTEYPMSFLVYFGEPDGGLSAPVAYQGCDGQAIALVDVDQDGDLDVVASRDDSLVVFFNDGHGNLSLGASYATGAHPDVIAMGDLDGDGRVDLVLGEHDPDSNSFAEVLRGAATGGFTEVTPLAGASSKFGILVGDLNQDGRPDIVANTIDGGELLVLLNQGDGDFARNFYPTPIFLGAAFLPAASGAPDLLVSTRPSTTPYGVEEQLQLLTNSGDGTFSVGELYALPGGGLPTVGDFNGDCILDVASAITISHGSCSTVTAGASVLYGDGHGGFGSPQTLVTHGVAPQELSLLGPVADPHALALIDGCGGGVEVFGDASRH